MPFPILAIPAAIMGILGIWGIWGIWGILKRNLKDKKLAVLGARKVGKSRLIDFLSTGSIPKDYRPDQYAREVKGRRVQLRDLELEIAELTHLPGDWRDYAQWKEDVNNADIVLYLLRVDKLVTGDKITEDRVEQDMKQISRWVKDKHDSEDDNKFPLFIIGTYCDLTDPDLTTLPADQIGDYADRVREMPIFQKIERLGGGGSKVRFVFGSLKSRATAEELVYHLFGHIVYILKQKG